MSAFKFRRNQRVILCLRGVDYFGHIDGVKRLHDNVKKEWVNVYDFTTLTYDRLYCGMGVNDHLDSSMPGIDWNFEEDMFRPA